MVSQRLVNEIYIYNMQKLKQKVVTAPREQEGKKAGGLVLLVPVLLFWCSQFFFFRIFNLLLAGREYRGEC